MSDAVQPMVQVFLMMLGFLHSDFSLFWNNEGGEFFSLPHILPTSPSTWSGADKLTISASGRHLYGCNIWWFLTNPILRLARRLETPAQMCEPALPAYSLPIRYLATYPLPRYLPIRYLATYLPRYLR